MIPNFPIELLLDDAPACARALDEAWTRAQATHIPPEGVTVSWAHVALVESPGKMVALTGASLAMEGASDEALLNARTVIRAMIQMDRDQVHALVSAAGFRAWTEHQMLTLLNDPEQTPLQWAIRSGLSDRLEGVRARLAPFPLNDAELGGVLTVAFVAIEWFAAVVLGGWLHDFERDCVYAVVSAGFSRASQNLHHPAAIEAAKKLVDRASGRPPQEILSRFVEMEGLEPLELSLLTAIALKMGKPPGTEPIVDLLAPRRGTAGPDPHAN